MSPKHKLITTVWCAVTMVATLMLSHGHLIVRELMRNWPQATTWEGRFESAIYTAGWADFLCQPDRHCRIIGTQLFHPRTGKGTRSQRTGST